MSSYTSEYNSSSGDEDVKHHSSTSSLRPLTRKDITEQDINIVREHSKCTSEEAINALIKSYGDLVAAIMMICDDYVNK